MRRGGDIGFELRLQFFRVYEWKGEPHPREDQAISWQRAGASMAAPMLPANAPILAALALPDEYAVTNAAQYGAPTMLSRMERRLRQGLKLIQIRESGFAQRDVFTRQAIELAHRYGCKVMVKEPLPGADGMHFTASQLLQLGKKPEGMLVAASCHTREELERAADLGLDFVVLGPVRDKSPALGWQAFRQLSHATPIPIYAIGGLNREDLQDAWRAGAHGVAMIRGAWK